MRFDQAKKQPDDASLFSIVDATLNGETKKAVAIAPTGGTASPGSAQMPDDGVAVGVVGMKPEAWTQEGDGV